MQQHRQQLELHLGLQEQRLQLEPQHRQLEQPSRLELRQELEQLCQLELVQRYHRT